MGKITALKVQKNNPNRVSVYLDNEYAFGLSRIVAAWLKVGMELSGDKIATLQAQDAFEVAYQQALHFISYRPRSEMEVRQKLAEKGADDLLIERVIGRLKDSRLVGDEQFARTWVDNRSAFRPRSHRMLRYELRQKGVEDEFIQNALQEAVAETDLAYQAGSQYAHRLTGLDWETFRKRLAGFLSRRGFSYGISAPVIRQLWEESRTEEQ
jgi:regulatory protein